MLFAKKGPSTDAREFIQANRKSPVVHAAGRDDGGALFILANLRRFELSNADMRWMPILPAR